MPLSIPKSPAREESLAVRPLRNREQTRSQHSSLPLRFIRSSDAPQPLTFWHLASLDAPTVAVVWSWSFAWVAKNRLPLWFPVLLALTVWTIYVGDRLLDARSGLHDQDHNRLCARHYFHWRHRGILLPAVIAAACLVAFLIFAFMPAAEQAQYSILALVFLAYLARIHWGDRFHPFLWRTLSKELLVGFLFTIGCALPTLRLLPDLPSTSTELILCSVTYFAFLAWLNCSAINTWESRAWEPWNQDRAVQNQAVDDQAWPFSMACFLAVAGLLLAAFLPAAQIRAAILLLAGSLSAILLAWLDCLRNRLNPVALRAAADFVLLTPAVFIAITWIATR